VWHAGLFARETCGHLRDAGFAVRAQIIWRKRRPVFSRGHYHWQHEPCWYVVRKGRTATWSGDRRQRTVWDIAVDPVLDVPTKHSTQKPVECMLRAMRNHGRRGSWVYDPFVGSGSSIIAAELCGRSCLAMELSREYCRVAIDRWQSFSGKKAEVIA
jgi:DNA modification methylase